MGQFDDFSNPWSASNSQWFNEEYTNFDTKSKHPNNDIWSKGNINHDRWFSSVEDKFSKPNVKLQQNTIKINILDTVESVTITHIQTNIGSSYRITNNKLTLNKFSRGVYYLKVFTKSEGVYDTQFYVDGFHPKTTLEFKKVDFDFELIRVKFDTEGLPTFPEGDLAQTFVSTDIIKIQFNPTDEFSYLSDEFTPELTKLGFGYKDIIWKVRGITKNDGNVEIQKSDLEFIHSFKPKPINRPTSGSRTPNSPIKYIVTATLLGLNKSFELEQDEIDILRQEYIDFNTNWKPKRDDIYEDNGRWNTGNYGYIASQTENVFANLLSQLENNWNTSYPNIVINVSSSYRNPRRNKEVGSNTVNSRHTKGRAMDVTISNPTKTKWVALKQAANDTDINGVNAHCDQSGTFVDNRCEDANHIHIQW